MTNTLNVMLILPEIFLAITAMGFLMVGVFQGNKSTDALCWMAALSCTIAALIILRGDWETQYALNNMIISDEFSSIMKLIILIGIIASLGLSIQYLYQERIARFEYPVLVMFAGVGMMLMVSANNLLSLYMALELQSLSLYVLAAFHRNSMRSGEAAAKYFILGVLSSGMLLFGTSLVYGYTGSLDFVTIGETLKSIDAIPPGFTIGMVFILVALVFKISAAPFHMWTPDVYQGAPTSVTAFFALVPKIAAMALLMRLLYGPFAAAQDQWTQILYFVSVMSLLFGSFAAIAQENIKRLLAYSSIGNIGYALIGLVAGTELGVSSVIVFLMIYMIMTAGSFAIVMCMRRDGIAVENIKDLAGLSKNQPVFAYAMSALMFSMSGIPPMAGFFGKLFIFNAAISSGYYGLAVFGVLASVVAAYYYLRIIKVMFFDEPADAFDQSLGLEKKLVLTLSLVFVLGFIFKPMYVLSFAKVAAHSLF